MNQYEKFFTVEDFLELSKGKYHLSNPQKSGFIVFAKESGNYYKTDVKQFIPLLKTYLGASR